MLTPESSPDPLSVPHRGVWRLQVLGGMLLRRGDVVLTNLGSRSVANLLARLALFPKRIHPREELIELLWPGVSLDVGRNRLRQAIFTLRQQLEPPGLLAPVLVTDRHSVRLVADAVECDAVRFARHVAEGRYAEALVLYRGELLPGCYDEWIGDERRRLDALHERAVEAAPAAAPAAPMASDDPTAPAMSPSMPPVPADHHSLPHYLTRFVGREAEGARLRAEVHRHRLVTLLGPGGSGKTRLAVELAAALRTPMRRADGTSASAIEASSFDFVAFVPLANSATRAQLVDVLLASLRLGQHEADPLAALVAAFTGRRTLLVLDNFEQLGGRAEDVVAELVARLPALHLLVTSRRVLGLDGEREFVVLPLTLPAPGAALGDAAINPAVALFVDRAQAVRAGFQIGPSNLAAIVELVHLLEGMPLAIELAAARVRSLTPAAMAGLLQAARRAPGGQTLDLLSRSGPRAGGDPRHASMLGVIAWSWRLLDAVQARLLAALTVFHGGCTAQAATALCGDFAPNTALRLDELVSHSLLRVNEPEAAATRYTTFEPVREYARLQLDAPGARALRAGHRAWMTAWAQGLPPTPSLAEVRLELPNLLAALTSALADDAPDEAIRLMLPLRRVLEDVELPADGLASLAEAIDRCADPALASQGHTLIAPLMFIAGRSAEAERHAQQGLAGAPEGAPWRGRALHAAARVRWRATRREPGVTALLDAAEPLARAAGDAELLASLIAMRAFVANGRREHARGEALHAQALALWQRAGNRHAINSGRYNLAVCAQNAGRHDDTLAQLDVIEPEARALHDWRRLSQMLNVRGNALSESHRWQDAVAAYRECIRLSWQCLALHELAYGLWNMPRALAHVRDAERSVRLAAFVETFWQARFGPLNRADGRDLRRLRRLAGCSLPARQIDALWADGAQLPLADAVALALQ